MPQADINGRVYARLPDLKAGDWVQMDGDFPCIKPNAARIVRSDAHGLYVRCNGPDGECTPLSEKHYLDGQEQDDSDALIGVYPLEEDQHAARRIGRG